MIYTLPYNKLTSYLQGVRDMINLINGEEPNDSIANTIIIQLKGLKDLLEDE
jgi:hypothetical protein